MIATRLRRSVILSPNIEARRAGTKPDILLLHYTGMASADKACAWLCAPESKVSCHYLVDEQGRITQMVDELDRAWHAGESSWAGDDDINSRSIGIEIQNPGHGGGYPDFPVAQMQSVLALSLDICARHDIAPPRVLAHSDVAPGRKIDPGEKFDWAFLHRNGVGHWVTPETVSGGAFLQAGDSGDPVMALQGMLHLYGYGIEPTGVYDTRTKIVVEAFQRHFRQNRVDGVADQSTVATLHQLLAALKAA